MTLVQLEYLLAVVNCGSFSAAAEHCFVTQPSLSMQIKSLEEELGVVLLDRSRKPVIPTQTGEVVAELAREALIACGRIAEAVEELRGEVRGTLTLGAIPTVAPYLAPRFVPLFAERYPHAELTVKEMKAADIYEALSRDALDAALMTAGDIPEGLNDQELFDDPFCAYVPPANNLWGRSNIRPEDINVRELLVMGPGHCLREQILELCQTDAAHCCTLYECDSVESLIRMADSTGYMTVIPRMAAESLPAELQDRIRSLNRDRNSRKIVLVTRRSSIKSNLISVLKETILSLSQNR